MVERIWSSSKIAFAKKKKLLARLEGNSDWLENTKMFCEAAHPGNKEKVWHSYFSEETSNWSLT